MIWSDVLLAQMMDPFRIGLLLALGWMTLRLREQSGVIAPLLAGVLFFAILLPNTMPMAAAPVQTQMMTGVVANAIIMAVIVGGWLLLQRFRR